MSGIAGLSDEKVACLIAKMIRWEKADALRDNERCLHYKNNLVNNNEDGIVSIYQREYGNLGDSYEVDGDHENGNYNNSG